MKIYKLISEGKSPNFSGIRDIVLKEETDSLGRKRTVTEIVGPFIQCGVENRNGRIYVKDIMQAAVQKYVNDRMAGEKLRSYGELGHPEDIQINLHRISHMVTELKWDGENVIGRAKLLDTEYGRIAKTIIEADGQLGVSSRGVGSLNSPNSANPKIYEDAINKHGANANIVTEFDLIAIDIVCDPSGPEAFVQGIMESKDYILVGGEYKQIELNRGEKAYNNLEKTLEMIPRKERDQYLHDAVQRFLNSL